jgi:hypothetical protein
MEIDDREQKERERLQKEADQEMEKINFEKIATFDEELNPYDPKTRLIGKSSTSFFEWSRPEEVRGKKGHEYTLYWRKKNGNYFKFTVNAGTFFENIDAKAVHDLMNKRAGFQWFLTDAQKKELQEQDESKE